MMYHMLIPCFFSHSNESKGDEHLFFQWANSLEKHILMGQHNLPSTNVKTPWAPNSDFFHINKSPVMLMILLFKLRVHFPTGT